MDQNKQATDVPEQPCDQAKAIRRSLVYPVLLDDGFLAQVVIPIDMSETEWKRLSLFLHALVVPWRT